MAWIEGTHGELRAKVKTIVGERSFDEGKFRAMMRALPSNLDFNERMSKVDWWAWLCIDPLAPSELALLGHGADHAVYTDPRDPNRVMKISVTTLQRLARWNWLFGRTGHDEIPKALLDEGRALASNESKRYALLQRYFPAGCVPEQTVSLENVAVRGAALEYLLSGLHPDARKQRPPVDPNQTYRLPALVSRQDLLPQLSDPSIEHFSLSLRFLERLDDAQPRMYADANNHWILNRSGDFDEAAFRYCMRGAALETLYDACRTDPVLRESVRDFLSRSIDFMNDTREMVDVAGDGNVFFHERRSYYLVDALSNPNLEQAVEQAAHALRRLLAGETLSRADRWCVAFTLNIIRAMNSMAHALGVSRRVHLLSPEEERTLVVDWNKIRPELRIKRSKAEGSRLSGGNIREKPLFIPVVSSPWGRRTAPA